MTQRRILFLDANRLSSYAWQSGQLRASREFTADNSGLESFAEYLSRHANTVFYILADVAEEGFQIEDVPHVSGKDRSALTARRLGQYFYGTPFALAISLGREKAGRRDEKVLFAAITQPRHFEPWLEVMRNAGTQLAGIYSAPQALTLLFGGPARLKGPQLVISISRSGVRQTFFNDGKLHFSRLTILATGSLEEAAVACAVEAGKIYQYLTGQRLVARHTPLTVQILAHPAQFSTIRGHCRSSTELNFEYLDLPAEAIKAKLKSPIPDSNCEMLLMHEVVRRTPSEQFAPAAERHFFRLWQVRSGLTAAAVIIFSACLIYAGKQYFSAIKLNEATVGLQAERQIDQRKYEAALKKLPQLPVTTDDLRTLVDRFDDLSKRSPSLEMTLIPLSHALDAVPGVQLQKISWQLTDKLPTLTKEQMTGSFKQPPLNIVGSYYAVADVEAQLPVALINDHRAMLQLLDQFTAELGKVKGLGLQMTQLPFDVESGKTIKNTGEDAPLAQAEAPKFSFRLIQGL